MPRQQQPPTLKFKPPPPRLQPASFESILFPARESPTFLLGARTAVLPRSEPRPGGRIDRGRPRGVRHSNRSSTRLCAIPNAVVYRHEVFRELEDARGAPPPCRHSRRRCCRTRAVPDTGAEAALQARAGAVVPRGRPRPTAPQSPLLCRLGARRAPAQLTGLYRLSARLPLRLRSVRAASAHSPLMFAASSPPVWTACTTRCGSEVPVSPSAATRVSATIALEVEETFARFREREGGEPPGQGPRLRHDGSRRGADRAACRPPLPGSVPSARRVLQPPHGGFLDQRLATFDREVPVSASPTSSTRSGWHYPERGSATRPCRRTRKEISAEDAFDIALAGKLVWQSSRSRHQRPRPLGERSGSWL